MGIFYPIVLVGLLGVLGVFFSFFLYSLLLVGSIAMITIYIGNNVGPCEQLV